MKKTKEFLLLFVPLVVFTVLPIMFVTNQNKNAFIGNEHYLRLLLNDSVFKTAIFNIYCYPFVFSLFTSLFVALLCRFINLLNREKSFIR